MSVAEQFSVIICTYTEERWNWLAGAVHSVQTQSMRPLEVIVVVDHNRPLLRRISAELSGVTAVANDHARGLSGARNTGLRLARASIVAFLDDDAVASADWLAQLATAYRDPVVAGVGGMIEPIWETCRPRWFPPEFDWVVGCTYRGMPATASPVRNLLGCNMSFRRDIFNGIGGFRTGLGRVGADPLGCEETDFCIRLKFADPGRVLLYQPRARVLQHVPRGRASFKYFVSRCFAEGVSKALISRLVGFDDGLASERAHIRRVLPTGIVHGVRDAALHRDLHGLARAGAIAAGLGTAAAGYTRGLLNRGRDDSYPYPNWSLESIGSRA